MSPEQVVARARGCVGAPFRAQGRSVEHGLDCVGLALIAFGIEGQRPRYALRGGEVSAVMAMIADAGLVAAAVGGPAAGDLMLHRAGAQHLHLTIATGDGYVHACGRIGRVVEVKDRPPWVVVGRWKRGVSRPPVVVPAKAGIHPGSVLAMTRDRPPPARG